MLNGYEPIIQNITSGYEYVSSSANFITTTLTSFDVSGVNGDSTVTNAGEFILETVSQSFVAATLTGWS